MKRTPIKPKAKKCAGTGLAKGHGCGKETMHSIYGLGKMCGCYSDWLLNSENGKLKMQRAMFVSKKERSRIERDKTKEAREKLKTLSQYEAEAKAVFQKWVRLRDKDLPCISCGNPKPTDWCGSHYFAAGTYSGMIFDERNVHGACNTFCNLMNSGNLIGYRIGLVNRFGEDFVKQLEYDANERRNYKYTKAELIEIKQKYLKKIKEL